MSSFRFTAWHRPTAAHPWQAITHGGSEGAAWQAVSDCARPGQWIVLRAVQGAPQPGDVYIRYEAVAVAWGRLARVRRAMKRRGK